MSKHNINRKNYNAIYNVEGKEKNMQNESKTTTNTNPIDDDFVEDSFYDDEFEENETCKKVMIGKVVRCIKLAVRDKPSKSNSEVLSTLDEGTTVTINSERSTDDFYCIGNGGEYCAKDYIEIIEE